MANEQNGNKIDPKVEAKYIKYAKAIATGFAAIGVGSIIGGGALLASTTSLLSVSGAVAMSSFFFGGFLINNSFQMWGKMKEFELQRQVIHESSRQKSHNMTHNLSKIVVKTDSKQDGLLTRAFARPPKDNDHDREWAAQKRLRLLRERDASGMKMTVKSFAKQKAIEHERKVVFREKGNKPFEWIEGSLLGLDSYAVYSTTMEATPVYQFTSPDTIEMVGGKMVEINKGVRQKVKNISAEEMQKIIDKDRAEKMRIQSTVKQGRV